MDPSNHITQSSQINVGDDVGDAVAGLQALQQVQNDAAETSGSRADTAIPSATTPSTETVVSQQVPPPYAFAAFIPDPSVHVRSKEEIDAFVRVVSVKDDIVLSEIEIEQHPILAKRNGPKTRIHHIKGVLMINIDAKALEQYCRKLNGRIKDIRRKKKEVLCRELVALKVADDRFGTPSQPAAVGDTQRASSDSRNSNKLKRVRVNYYRLVNVLGLESIKPLVVGINSHLSRADLDAGRKAGKELFLAMSQAYNDVLNEEIDLVKWGFGADDCDPSDYEGDLSPTQIEAAF